MIVWIINHYATRFYLQKDGRHYSLAKYAKLFNVKINIICSNRVHNLDNSVVNEFIQENISSFYFVKTPKYKGNGISRIINILAFYFKTKSNYKRIENRIGKPDVIIGSSPHILSGLAARKIAKKYKIPFVFEVRDLWPLSIIDYGYSNKKSIIIKSLFFLEASLYHSADSVIFTMPGGLDYVTSGSNPYIVNKRLVRTKFHYFNNGVDLPLYHERLQGKVTKSDTKVVTYVGSIRKANDIDFVLDSIAIVNNQGNEMVEYHIYGSGTELQRLKRRVEEESLTNVYFFGHLEKLKVPAILASSYANILHFGGKDLVRFGSSMNKTFDYLASGKPILSSGKVNYDIVEKYDCGLIAADKTPEEYAKVIIEALNLSKEKYNYFCNQALLAVEDFDYSKTTKKYLEMIGLL